MKKLIYLFTAALAATFVACSDDFAYPPVSLGDVKGDGTAEDPYNVAKAIRVCAATGETPTDPVFVGGYVYTGSIDTSYGNGSFDIYDSPDGSGSKFTVYRIKGFNNQKFTDENQIKVGDYIVIYGPIYNFRGNTPENGNGAYLYSINGVVGSDTPTPDEPGAAPAGNGTIDSPYNIAKAIEVAKANGESSDVFYYVEGFVGAGSQGIDTSYGNATWDLYDSASGGGNKFIAYRVKDFDGAKFTDANKVKAGDKVVIYAPIINYKGNTPETGSGGYLYSINGTTGGNDTPGTPDTPDTPAEGQIYSGLVNDLTGWELVNELLPEGAEYIWSWKVYNDSGYLNASAYLNNAAHASEAYAYTTIDLAGKTQASLSFDHAAKFQTTLRDLCGCVVRVDGDSEWTSLAIPTWPEAGSWTFVNSGAIDLTAYAGKKVQLGFVYKSTDAGADTWEIKNFLVQGK